MPQVQYPFIDIAVHPAIRGKFAAGEAIALFSRDMAQVLWANGEGAKLFGHANIYDLLDNGPDRSGVAFRQLSATARQLEEVGDRRGLVMRVNAGFSSQTIAADVSLVEIRRGEIVVIFSAPVAANSNPKARFAAMLKGFDDPDTHMAVIDDQGAVLAASPGYAALGILPETARTLVATVARSSEGLIKRPIASAAGYLPAAIGRLSIDPPLNLVFCVETVLGRMDPPQEMPAPENIAEPAATETQAEADTVEKSPSLLGAEETETLPVEGLVETVAEAEAKSVDDAAEIKAPFTESASFLQPVEAAVESITSQAEHSAPPALPAVEHDIETPIGDGPENLELAADQAETSSARIEPGSPAEIGMDIHPDNLELTEDQAEAGSLDEFASAAEPEDYTEAEMAEAALNETDTSEDVADLATIDGASAEDVEAHSTSGNDDEQEMHAAVEPIPEAEAAREPEDHAEAAAAKEIAEFTDTTEALGHEENEEAGPAVEAAASDDIALPAFAEQASVTPEQPTNIAAAEIPALAENAVPDNSSVSESAIETSVIPGADIAEPTAEATADAATGHQAPDTNIHDDMARQEPAELQSPASDDTYAAYETPAASESAFTFRRDGRPVRFVWKLDAEGRFSEVSDEFPRTVGPHAGSINGMAYRDLDNLFHLDPSREIATLLERRDTWSGRTIRWPVEGTDLVVPVDLAALPTYSRNREFDGFRGFGIIRVADAENDPHAVGLSLGETKPQDMQPELVAAESAENDLTKSSENQPGDEIESANPDEPVNAPLPLDTLPLTVDGQFDDAHPEPQAQVPEVSFSEPETINIDNPDKTVEDKFGGEVPALRLGQQELSDVSEKIIQLEERRSRGREGLTQTEQNALREIARQLEPFGKRPNETLLDQQETPAAEQTSAEAADDESPIETALPDAAAADQPQVEALASLQAEEAPQSSEATPETVVDQPTMDAAEKPAEEAHDDIIARLPDADPGLTASATDQIPLAILIHAGDRLIHANAEFRRFSGYENLEALDAAGGLDALISRREGPDAGVYATRADGAQVPVAARLQSVRYEGAKLLMLTLTPAEPVASAQDTLAEDHEAARKLSALKVEAEELRSILETATDGVVVLDMDGRIRSMNRSASALFNFENSEIAGKPFAMLFAHESQKAVQDYLNGLSGHGVLSVLNDGREVIGREASGGFIPLFMTMGRMPGSNSYCAVIRDITQWKRSEDELKTAKRAAETANQHKSDFLARVSHEIRTPLNAIIGFADMIASEHFGPAGHPRYVEYANDIGRSGRHVLDIVNDLLDISKIEAGEMDLEFSAVGINECVSEAVSLVQPQANTQRVIIRTSLSQSVPDVVADLRSIKQIAINILANAIRFTPSGGQIVVSSAYEPNGSVTLRIRDTGIGMSAGELDQAMKPFGQVQPGARKRGDGTGLGLPLTRAMTEANRASFSIQSAPNEGTLVEITFPPQRVLAD